VSPMIDYLRVVGSAPPEPATELVSLVDVLIGRYVGYLVTERGLARVTVTHYTRTARSFLCCCGMEDGVGFDLGGLSAGDVTGYVLARCQRGPVAYTKGISSPLRGLLGFLFVEGLTGRDLSGAVPSAPDRRLNSLPKVVDPADVVRLLDSCDREPLRPRPCSQCCGSFPTLSPPPTWRHGPTSPPPRLPRHGAASRSYAAEPPRRIEPTCPA